MRTKLIKVHTIKSHLIVQFDKFNGHASVAISWGYRVVNSLIYIHSVVSRGKLPFKYRAQSTVKASFKTGALWWFLALLDFPLNHPLDVTYYAFALTIDNGRSFLGVVLRRLNPFLISARSLSTIHPSSSEGILLAPLPVNRENLLYFSVTDPGFPVGAVYMC